MSALNKELQEIEAQIEGEKENKDKDDLCCSWCKGKIIESKDKSWNFFYKCVYHRSILCYNCAHNFFKSEINYRDAPKCKQNYGENHIDCIWEKKAIKSSDWIPLSRMSKSAQYSFKNIHPELLTTR